MFDVIISGGLVVDGSVGAVPAYLDLGVKGERIEVLAGDLRDKPARTRINAGGCVVTPGFIDAHNHCDLMLLAEPEHRAKLLQGVTTEIVGQDGISYAPLSPDNLTMYRRYMAGLNGNPQSVEPSWSTMAEYRAMFDRSVVVNTAHLVGHGPIRLEAAGMLDVPLRGETLTKAVNLLDSSLSEGAIGLSTGLSYFPQSWADTQELVDLCKVVQRYDGVFVIHLRTIFRGDRFDPVEEAIEIARRSGVKLHFSHFRTGPHNAGRVDERLKPLDDARASGVDVSLDIYPYPQGASCLVMLLPPWANEGNVDRILDRLCTPGVSQRICDELDAGTVGSTWDSLTISHVASEKNRSIIGRTIADVAAEEGCSPEMLVCRLLAEEDLEVGFWINPPNQEITDILSRDQMQILSRPYAMVGSDSVHVGERPHPRLYGTFPRFLGRYRRAQVTVSLEELLPHLTSIPASRFGLRDRGVIRVGNYADILVFNPEVFIDKATYSNPRAYAEGMCSVIVNGKVVYKDGDMTGAMPGRPIP